MAVIGAKGMLGSDLVTAGRAGGFTVLGCDLPEMDISRDSCDFRSLTGSDWVVNCAAYTDVDGAESAPDTAFSVNRDGAARVAAWCAKQSIPLVHLSTDYVFDGRSISPYRENDPVGPVNVYGESKLAGERAVQSAAGPHLIVRTQSLFGLRGRNFVRAFVSSLREGRGPLRVVDDQVSCPTYAGHLADAILRLMEKGKQGIVHVSASGQCSWYAFARVIAGAVRPDAMIQPVGSHEYPRPAGRPAYSVLDKGRYVSWTGDRLPSWREGVNEYLQLPGAA